MSDWLNRTEHIFGAKRLQKLKQSRIAIFGAGGVGGFAIEAIARSGVGIMDIIDNDIIDITNLNRQILATASTVGRSKVEVAAERIKSINPDASIFISRCFVSPETIGTFEFSNFDYVVDAIDTVSGKLAIIEAAVKAGVPVISSMGTGNKIDPTQLTVTTIEKTDTDPLARIMRRELRKRGISGIKVVYSKEMPTKLMGKYETTENGAYIIDMENAAENKNVAKILASTSFVPSTAGLLMASVVIRDLIKL